MPLSISGDSPNFTNATLTTPTLTSPTFAGTPTGSIITSGTAVASTSGTSIDFTSIPSWVKRITVMFSGVSLSGTSDYLIQLGAGSVTTSGYVSICNTTTSTSGFLVSVSATASDVAFGNAQINLLNANTWTQNSLINGGSALRTGAGGVTLSGTLDRIRITTVNGTDTFDAGSINILYE
jgi:hypothetical protein